MPNRKDTTTTLVGSTLTHVKYELPPTIKSLQNGWLATFQSSAVISALFAGLEGLLLSLVKDPVGSGSESSSTGQALLAFTYIALFFSISSAMSALILTDEFGDITLRASRSEASGESTLKYDAYDEGSNQLLSRFNGGRQSWRWVMWHWLFTLGVGYICIILQLVLYVWVTERRGIKGLVVVIAIISTLPLLDFIVPMPVFWLRNFQTSPNGDQARTIDPEKQRETLRRSPTMVQDAELPIS